MQPLISAQGLHVSLGGRQILHGVDFAIHPGEIVTVVGPNGSGKSTLLRSLIGAIAPSRGSVRRSKGLRLGYVPQKLAVEANLPMTVARFLDLPTRTDAATKERALTQSGAEGLGTRQMGNLSGGQFQRVMMARALLNAPQLLILDEPTQGLDQPGSAAFYSRIEKVRDETGCAILMVSHELHVVMSASDRVICLNGHICCEGHPTVVAQAEEYQALFGTGTMGTLALYQHEHNHRHDHDECTDTHHHHDTV